MLKAGVREAAKMLAALNLAQREKVLALITEQDAQLADQLRQNMVVFEDLKLLTVSMLQEFLREIKVGDLALALRRGSAELQSFFFEHISSGMKSEIEEVLNGPPQKLSLVEEAEERVMSVVRKMIDEGKLVLSEKGKEEYV